MGEVAVHGNPDPNAVITNNSRAARDALEVTHTGNGANK